MLFSGIKSVIYPSDNLEADAAFWEKAIGVKPYFNQPYYVGFSVNGCELGLDPNAKKEGITQPIAYWLVDDAKAAAKQLLDAGASLNTDLRDVGGGMMMGTFKDASGNIFGIIDDPHDKA